MAAVPTGPSSALPASPAEIIPFPGDGSFEPGQGEQSSCGREGSVASGARQDQQVSEDKRSSKKKQKNMLSHANPPALLVQPKNKLKFHCQITQQGGRRVEGLLFSVSLYDTGLDPPTEKPTTYLEL